MSAPLLKWDLACERVSVLRSTRAKFMPCLWQSLATASPMPEAAPVMSAVLPALKTGWAGMVWYEIRGKEGGV